MRPWSLRDFQHGNDVARAECSAEEAAKLLDYAAGYLERGEVMPKSLADFIAKAFRATVRVDHDQRPVTLAAWLKLTALNRRPKYTKSQRSLAFMMFAMRAASFDWSETQTIAKIAESSRISKTQARTWWKEWKAENPSSLVTAERQGKKWKAWKAENPDDIDES